MNTKILKLLFLILFIGAFKTEGIHAACPNETFSIKNEVWANLVVTIGGYSYPSLSGRRFWYTDYCFFPGQSIQITTYSTGVEVYPTPHYSTDATKPPMKSFSMTCSGSHISSIDCYKDPGNAAPKRK